MPRLRSLLIAAIVVLLSSLALLVFRHDRGAAHPPIFSLSPEKGLQYRLETSAPFRLVGPDGPIASCDGERLKLKGVTLPAGEPLWLFRWEGALRAGYEGREFVLCGETPAVRLYGPLRVRSYPLCEEFGDSFGRAGEGEPAGWSAAGGTWRIVSAPDPENSVSPFHLEGSGEGLLLTGLECFREYVFRSAVRSGSKPSAFGIAAAVRDGRGLKAFWRPRRGWYGELVVSFGGGELWSRPFKAAPMQWYDFVLAVAGGRFLFSLDSWPLARGETPCCSGRAGLFTSGGAAFDDTLMLPLAGVDVTAEFEDGWPSLSMLQKAPRVTVGSDAGVMSPVAADWKRLRNGLFSFRGLVTPDCSLSLPLDVRFLPREVRFFTGSRDGAVVFRILSNGKTSVAVERDGIRLSAAGPFAAEVGRALVLSVARNAGRVCAVVSAGGKKTLVPLPGGDFRGGLEIKGRRLPRGLDVVSPLVRDYIFSGAPAAFTRAAGEWRVASRWACSPQYSWFGGRAHPLAALVSKFDIEGDFRLDVFTAPLMVAYMRPGYRHPCRMTIQAEGEPRPFGGHSLSVFTNGKHFLRPMGGEATTRKAAFGSVMPVWFHNRWLHLSLSLSGDNLEGLPVFGPPLKAVVGQDGEKRDRGPVSLWFYDNDFSIARLRVAAEAFRPRRPEGLDVSPPASAARELPEPPDGNFHPLFHGMKSLDVHEPQSVEVFCDRGDGAGYRLVVRPREWGAGARLGFELPAAPLVVRMTLGPHPPRAFFFLQGSGVPFGFRLDGPSARPAEAGTVVAPEGYIVREKMNLNGAARTVLTFYCGQFMADAFGDGAPRPKRAVISFLSPPERAPASSLSCEVLELFSLDFFSGPSAEPGLDFRSLGRYPSGFEAVLGPGETLAWLLRDVPPVFRADAGPGGLKVRLFSPFGVLRDSAVFSADSRRLAAVRPLRPDAGGVEGGLLPPAPGGTLRLRAKFSDSLGRELEARSTVRLETRDTTPPVVRLEKIGWADVGKAVRFMPRGGIHALYPVNEADSSLLVKRALGGFSGFGPDRRATPAGFPLAVGTYRARGNWALYPRLPAFSGPFAFMSLQNPRPNFTASPVPRPFVLSLEGAARPDGKITLGNYGFSTAQKDWWIAFDSFSLVPRLSSPDGTVSAELAVFDPSGVASVEYALFGPCGPAAAPPSADSAAWRPWKGRFRFPVREKGFFFLAVRARDTAGNLSRPVFFSFVFEQRFPAPRLVKSVPEGDPASPDAIVLATEGLVPSTVTVSSPSSSASFPELLSAASSFPCRAVFRHRFVASDAGSFDLVVRGSAFDGSPFEKTVKLRRGQLRGRPSALAALPVEDEKLLVFDDYENGVQHARARRGAALSVLPFEATAGRRCLGIRAVSNMSYFSATLFDEPFRPADYPLLEFDYRPENAKLSLMLKVGGSFYDVQLDCKIPLAPSKQPGRMRIAGRYGFSSGVLRRAEITPMRRGWVHVYVNLSDALRHALGSRAGGAVIERVALRAAGINPLGAEARVDNFRIYAPSRRLRLLVVPDASLPAGNMMVTVTDSAGKAVRRLNIPGPSAFRERPEPFFAPAFAEIALDGLKPGNYRVAVAGGNGGLETFLLIPPTERRKGR